MTLIFPAEVEAVSPLTARPQANPVLAPMANGGFLAAWSALVDGTDEIRARAYLADGRAVGDEFTVNGGPGLQGQPCVQRLQDGRTLIAWTNTTDGQTALHGRYLDAEGAISGNEFVIDDGSSGPITRPCLTALASGGFVASWDQTVGSTSEVFARVFSSDGQAGDTLVLASLPSEADRQVSLTALADGGFAACWDATYNTRDIAFRLFDATGTALGPEFTLNQSTTGSETKPDLIQLADGRILVVWEPLQMDPPNLQYRILSATGQPLGDVQTLSDSQDRQTDARVVALKDGGFAVLWRQDNGTDFQDIQAQIFNPDGSSRTDVFTPQSGSFANWDCDLAELADGRFVIIWARGETQADLCFRLVDARAETIGGQVLLFGEQFQPQLLQYGTELTVDSGASLSVWNQNALQSLGSGDCDVQITVLGHITAQSSSGQYSAIRLIGQAAGRGGHEVAIGMDGLVKTMNGTAIVLGGGENTIINAGTIDGNTAAVQAEEGSLTLLNTGRIDGDVRLGSANDKVTLQDGQITGTVFGGSGNDLYIFSSDSFDIDEASSGGIDTVESAIGWQMDSGIENLRLLGSAALAAQGNPLANRITGNRGGNSIQGNAGNDTLMGEAGADSLLGGTGDDRLLGGAGRDTLAGGSGADRFVFALASDSSVKGPDGISDFQSGQDKIDLTALVPGKLVFLAAGSFATTIRPALRLVDQALGLRIEVDLNNDDRADFTIFLTNRHAIHLSDLLL